MPAQNRRKRQIGITHDKGKRLLSIGGQPLFKATVNDYRKMKSPKPGVYAPKSEGNKHYYVLFDRRKQPGEGNNKKGKRAY